MLTIKKLYPCGIFILFSMLTIRVITMPIIVKRYFSESKNAIALQPRLKILDRKNRIIATNVLKYDLYLIPSKIINPQDNFTKIEKIIGNIGKNKKDKILAGYKTQHKGSVYLKGGITENQKHELIKNGVIGIEFSKNTQRKYMHKNLFSHIVGFVSSDQMGLSGIEKAYNSYLTNQDNENDLKLNLDIDIQNIIRDNLINLINKYKAIGGFGGLIDIETGGILAAVSLPDFDPNNISEYAKDDQVFFNRFTLGSYELGSVFKLFTAILAIQNKMDDFICQRNPEGITIGNYTIKDFSLNNIIQSKTLNLQDIFRYSSNICTVKLIQEIGWKKQYNLFQKIGLFDNIDIGIPEIGKTQYSDYKSDIKSATASYGHGIATTPIQFMYSLSNYFNSKKTTLSIIERKSKHYTETTDDIKKLLSIMRYNAQNASHLRNLDYDIGYKSGTAIQVVNGKYDSKNMILNGVVVYPTQKPKYIFLIGIQSPYVDNTNEKQIYASNILNETLKETLQATIPFLDE